MQTCLVRNTEWKETVKTLARIISRGAYILKIFGWDITDIKGNNFKGVSCLDILRMSYKDWLEMPDFLESAK